MSTSGTSIWSLKRDAAVLCAVGVATAGLRFLTTVPLSEK